ncbi:MAG: type III secretion system inner membrane ring subunit SctD [Pseudomonadota bacterium]
MDEPTSQLPEPPQIELRVLHGPQAGSRLPLESLIPYTVGSSDECAVMLAGAQIEPEHAILEAGPEGIRISPSQGKVVDNTRTEIAGGSTVPLGTVLQLGRVKLTIDSVEAPWPVEETVAPPPPPPPPPEKEPEAEAPAQIEVKPTARPAAAAPRKNMLAKASLAAATGVLALSAAAAAWLQADPAPLPESRPPPGPVARPAAQGAALAASASRVDSGSLVSDLVRNQGAGNALFAYQTAQGGWVIAGHVARASDREALQVAATVISPPPQLKVWLDKERVEQAEAFLAARNEPGVLELHAESGEGGALRLTGQAIDPERAAAVAKDLQNQRPDLAPMETRITGLDQLRTRFLDQLKASGLATKLKVVRSEPSMYLEGVLTAPELTRWETVFAEFTKANGSMLRIDAQVRTERESVELNIEAVVGGAFPYVITSSGRRVSPGGTLEGRTLASVREGELVFTDGLRVRFAQ